MMGDVEEFKKSALYLRSLDLHFEVNQFLKMKGDILDMNERRKLQKYATTAPRKIAHGMGQTNMKIRFKKLNEAKNSLLQLQLLLEGAIKRQGSKLAEYKKVEDYSIQVLKLFNYYFGQLKRKKQK